jgi:hypothetical protein
MAICYLDYLLSVISLSPTTKCGVALGGTFMETRKNTLGYAISFGRRELGVRTAKGQTECT